MRLRKIKHKCDMYTHPTHRRLSLCRLSLVILNPNSYLFVVQVHGRRFERLLQLLFVLLVGEVVVFGFHGRQFFRGEFLECNFSFCEFFTHLHFLVTLHYFVVPSTFVFGMRCEPLQILIAFLNDRDRGLPLMHVVREVLLHVVVFTVEIPVRSQDPPRTPWRRPSWNSTCRRPSISVPITVLAPLGRKSRSPWSVLALVEGEGSWVAGGAVECAREDLSDWQKYSSGSVER